jgi:hypothetical protein
MKPQDLSKLLIKHQDLSIRTKNVLENVFGHNYDTSTLEDLSKIYRKDLLERKNFGIRCLREIYQMYLFLGYDLQEFNTDQKPEPHIRELENRLTKLEDDIGVIKASVKALLTSLKKYIRGDTL